MDFHSLSDVAALRAESVGRKGLSENEAEKRKERYGANRLEEPKKPSPVKRFFSQLSDVMILALIVSAGISFIISLLEKTGNFTDTGIILGIVIVNAVIGVIQESRAEAAIDALKKLSVPQAVCLRDGEKRRVPSEDVVPGDILLAEAGDRICADGRILFCEGFTVNESALTGEAHPVEKNAGVVLPEATPLAERINCVYASSEVATGRAAILVSATGMGTEVGRVASLMTRVEREETPLQKKLADVGKKLALGAALCCALVFAVGLLRSFPPLYMLITSVSLAVAAIPEGLPATVTVMLALGVSRMAKKRAVVRHLPAVETLGSAGVICSDKTGTLTTGKMSVAGVFGDRKHVLSGMALCSDADGVIGSPTENALVRACPVKKAMLEAEYPRVSEIPFSSETKYMATVHRTKDGYRTLVKGAADVILPRCTMTEDERADAVRACRDMAGRGYRVLALAEKPCRSEKAELSDLHFCGLTYLSDPLREGSRSAVRQCRRAGIIVIMITGDHKDTALAAARELGMEEAVLTGPELSAMTDKELREALRTVRVFARVKPEHKLRIVRTLKAMGHIVAMTGDGVNDAPALRSADIGCAMGGSGTDVARQSADMVLTDDNFATVVEAVREGRILSDNIRKAVRFLLSSNIGEILVMLAGMLLGFGTPLYPIELLWVNLLTDSFPAIALGLDRGDDNVMERPPETPGRSIFSDGLGKTVLAEGLLIGAISLTAFCFGRLTAFGSEAVARTMAFCTLSLSQLVHAMDVHTEKSLLTTKDHNPWLCAACLFCAALQIAVVVIPPLRPVFGTAALTGKQALATALLSLVPFFTSETEKRIGDIGKKENFKKGVEKKKKL